MTIIISETRVVLKVMPFWTPQADFCEMKVVAEFFNQWFMIFLKKFYLVRDNSWEPEGKMASDMLVELQSLNSFFHFTFAKHLQRP